MERVKQRIIETIIQINRTHTLPAYGLLLVGPAGTGKSQIAYAVARILKLPWTTLDMSSINDPEQLTGSSRIYALSLIHIYNYLLINSQNIHGSALHPKQSQGNS